MPYPRVTPPLQDSPGLVELLRRLVRFDTTNPPGNEGACLRYIQGLLTESGVDVELLGPSRDRPNLVARLKGRGSEPPLLMYGHVDVVTTAGQEWTHPPFEARIEDGFVWGRGTLDMKGGIVMMLSALLRAKSENPGPPGDVLLALVSDEEAGGEQGAKFLAQNHAELFDGVSYAIGEFGGFSFDIGNRRFYPIMVAEKQSCWIRLRIRGHSGHGSLAHQPGAMAKLSAVLRQLEERRLPVHVTPVTRLMIESIGSRLPFPASLAFRAILRPALTNMVFKLLGDRGRLFSPLFRNTVNPTMVTGGQAVNLTPGEIVLDLDARLLPGYTPGQLLEEVRGIIGEDVAIEVVRFEPGPTGPDLGFFQTIAAIVRQMDPEGEPVPMLLPASTDARHLAKLGIQTYGFLPMRLPAGFNFSELIHGPDERLPIDALEFGSEAVYRLIMGRGETYPRRS